jgi:hypothetical protein
MYFGGLKDYKISPKSAKWGYRISMLGLVLLAIAFIADRVTHTPTIALVSFIGCGLCMLITFLITVPFLMLSFAFIFTPIILVIFGITHEHHVWTTWWFWVVTVLCEAVGILIMAWFDANYRIR